MKCLDTDLLIGILRGREEAKKKAEELDREGRGAATTINAFELFYGAHRSRERGKNLEEAERLCDRLDVFPLDLESARKAGEIAARLASKGEGIDYRDVMIAGVVLSKGLTLVTRNKAHFERISGLKVEQW